MIINRDILNEIMFWNSMQSCILESQWLPNNLISSTFQVIWWLDFLKYFFEKYSHFNLAPNFFFQKKKYFFSEKNWKFFTSTFQVNLKYFLSKFSRFFHKYKKYAKYLAWKWLMSLFKLASMKTTLMNYNFQTKIHWKLSIGFLTITNYWMSFSSNKDFV